MERLPRRSFGAAEVRKVLSYCPISGQFVWAVRVQCFGGGRAVGSHAGTIKDGYVEITLYGRRYRAHHLAWLLMTGEWPPIDSDMDHRNGVRADNSWDNLRLATRTQNNANARRRERSSTGIRGVYRTRGRFFARVVSEGQIHHLGVFDSIEAAAAARNRAARRLFGEFFRAA
ncbi:MAG: HNH endonuclease signature motif containing protein [Sinimarinibacterium flocculans]|uniref:HNH endonuclease signature motif containing protein n=1 Tax=Sinimarinibacterium flocculans TaxID=985250 RepID=UPI003C5BC1E2